MILPVEAWMDLRRYKPLRDAGATWREIADEVGLDWRTVKRYLSADATSGPPVASSRKGAVARKIDALAPVVDAWLAGDPRLKASVIHERLVAEHGFDGHYQRVKLYVAEARERLARDSDADSGLHGLHRRFEVVAGAQAQVDWGDEGAILFDQGIAKVYSFHMTLSYSREAAAFAAHYGFVIDVLAARRPTGKGRVERQVAIVRDHVLTGRSFESIAELDGAFNQWVPIRRAQRHRTHGELIGVRAQIDQAALGPLPELPYLVCDRHLRRVGRDCLISFEGSSYSIPARASDGRPARAGQRVELRVSAGTVTIHRLAGDGDPIVLAAHPRAPRRGAMVIDPAHWNGLPDGHTRAVTLDPPSPPPPDVEPRTEPRHDPLADLIAAHPAAATRSRGDRWAPTTPPPGSPPDRRPAADEHTHAARRGRPRLDQRERATPGPGLAGPVGIQNSVTGLDQRFQAAGSYWLMRPPRMGRHRILP